MSLVCCHFITLCQHSRRVTANKQSTINSLVAHIQQHKVNRSKVGFVGAATTGSAVAAQQEKITR